jgi:hypothetical protein
MSAPASFKIVTKITLFFLLSLLAIVVISLAKFWQIFGKLVGAVPAQRTVSDKTNLLGAGTLFCQKRCNLRCVGQFVRRAGGCAVSDKNNYYVNCAFGCIIAHSAARARYVRFYFARTWNIPLQRSALTVHWPQCTCCRCHVRIYVFCVADLFCQKQCNLRSCRFGAPSVYHMSYSDKTKTRVL